MLDFLIITHRIKKGEVEVYPKFIVKASDDLMIRGGDFYAVWLEDKNVWSRDEQDLIAEVDRYLDEYAEKNKDKFAEYRVRVLHMWDSESGVIDLWHKYCQKQLRDNYHELDSKLIFLNEKTDKNDYSSKRLDYSLEKGDISAYDELMSVLYAPEERHKIEWAIGAIITGDSKIIQKFLVLYGPPGSGKSTVLNIIQWLFDGYYSVFDAATLGSASATFALEQFKTNPLVGISHDGDLSRIEKNSTINSLVSHETMTVNEKHKSLYFMKFNTFLFMGTNKPVKITDAKSGIIRRLIDVRPTGNKITPLTTYNELMNAIKFELGGIAWHCQEVYLEDPYAYDNYKPILMMGESNDFFNFIEDSYQLLRKQNGIALKQAWELYKLYCDDAKVPYPMSMRVFKSELKNYFQNYDERIRIGDEWVRSYYSGFKTDVMDENKPRNAEAESETVSARTINFEEQDSYLDKYCAECPAQYANSSETPYKKWENVDTKLKDLDTHKLHYVKVPSNLIVIDFDIKDENGKKSFEKNLEAAAKWPKTYAELSKSGQGIHLHYIYTGDDVESLNRIYSEDIEVKVYTGNSSLRRKLTKCNNEPINPINSGLPKKEKKMINFKSIANEKALRTIIIKNLRKEYHGATKPSVDFIYDALEDAYNSGMSYDVSDMHDVILSFAASSTHQSEYCVKMVSKMHFKSDDISKPEKNDSSKIVFYDVEVFPNLLLVNWKKEGASNVVRMINPTPNEITPLFNYRLVGFNCRRYDNHILYARGILGYDNKQLYELSQNIVNNGEGFFGEAYNISYTDIYDYASKKQSLKKWEIELGIHHQELGLPWDQPVPESEWDKVAEYCDNDVISTEAVWNATKGDFTARMILADLAGMSVNDKTNSLTRRIIFGKEKHPKLNYVDLSKEFPGYQFIKTWNEETKKYDRFNMYRGVDLGFGGYVYAEPGMYGHVALLDVASLHPHSIIAMNLFGDYTKNFENLVDIRIHIKHGEYDVVREEFGGKLKKYLKNETTAKQLSQALKIAINSVYGLTSAQFDNPFRDPLNENNVVALRGALFMKTLQDEVVKRGFKVIHIKTDSIKIPDATPKIIDFCMEFAKKYGYTFEHEATYDRICLVNDAVYIAKLETPESCQQSYGYIPGDNAKDGGKWTATGTQFQIPYVFKTCFSREPIEFRDMCETKEVKTAMYIDMNENLPEGEHLYRFIGKVGLFCPIKPGCGGGILLRSQLKPDGSTGMNAVVGTKDYRWLESEEVYSKHLEKDIDTSYYNSLVDSAIQTIGQYGDYEWFISDDPYVGPYFMGDVPLYDEGVTNPTNPNYRPSEKE